MPGSFYCFCGFAPKKSFTIGTITGMGSISVTCVVLGNMATLDSERGRMSPKISSPFRRNISEMCSSRTPPASPWMKRLPSKFLGKPDENSFGAPDVAEPIRVLVLDHFADELRAAFAEPGERIVDVLHGEHDA